MSCLMFSLSKERDALPSMGWGFEFYSNRLSLKDNTIRVFLRNDCMRFGHGVLIGRHLFRVYLLVFV